MKNCVFYLLVALSLAMIPSAFAQNPQRGLSVVSNLDTWGKYHALIIGINKYAEWPQLKTAVKDASVLKDVLVARYGFEEKNVILRTNKKATRHQIIRDLRYLAISMDKTDNLLIYYAGHGQLDDLTGDGYWVPAEGGLKDPSTWVSNSLVKKVLGSDRVLAKNVIVIADSCYSGSMLRGGPSLMSLDDRRYLDKLRKQSMKRSRQVISSGGVEPVADGGAQGHSLFAYYLINALKENNREVIDLENLFHTKVWRPVTEIGNQRPNVGRLKTPMDQDGQFVLYNAALTRAKSRAASRQPATGKYGKTMAAGAAARTAPQNLNAEEELWEIVKTSTSIEDFTLFLDEYPHSRFSAHARLKLQQLKRKQNAQRMTAAVAPAVVKPKPARPVAKSAVTEADIVASKGNYIKYSTGIVYDKKSGLEWYVGPDEDTSWHQADKWVKGLDVGGGGWRLPTKNDLKSIYSRKTGKRNMSPLLKTTGWWVWSAHTANIYSWYQKAYYFKGHSKYKRRYDTATVSMRAFAVRSRKDVSQIKSATKKENDLYASVAPAVVDQSRSNSRRAAQNSYRLAIFSINIYTTGWGVNYVGPHESEGIKGIASVASDDDRLTLKYCYREIEGSTEGVTLLKDIIETETISVWKKKSLFSKLEPDWDKVRKIGLKIGANLIIMMTGNLETGIYNYYLYDSENNKIYSKKANSHYSRFGQDVQIAVRDLVKDFFKQQP